MKIKIYDNGGETFDRFTVVYLTQTYACYYGYLGMSENPFSPQGYCQHGSCTDGPHLGKEIKFEDLPEACQRAVKNDLEELG